MVIDKIHGLHATSISLHDRFSVLQCRPVAVPLPQHGFSGASVASIDSLIDDTSLDNDLLHEEMSRKLEMHNKRDRLKQRMGFLNAGKGQRLRRFGSENSLYLPNPLQRIPSHVNLHRGGIKSRLNWGARNFNMNRSASYSNLSAATWGGGGAVRRGRWRKRFRRGPQRQVFNSNRRWSVQTARGNGFTPGRGRGRAGLRKGGGTQFNKTNKTKEELDAELEAYMAGTRGALDNQLDVYMESLDQDMGSI